MPTIDISFAVTGNLLPVDHSYALFGAVSRLVPTIHEDEQVGLYPIHGKLVGDRMLELEARSRLSLRVPAERVAETLVLAGQTLEVAGHQLAVGIPRAHELIPATRLKSRLVTIKGFTEAAPFLEAAQRQLEALEINALATLVSTQDAMVANAERAGGTKSPWVRRTVRIHDKEIVGFALRISELTAAESVRLQEKGIGGRRRFGCGLFVPERD